MSMYTIIIIPTLDGEEAKPVIRRVLYKCAKYAKRGGILRLELEGEVPRTVNIIP